MSRKTTTLHIADPDALVEAFRSGVHPEESFRRLFDLYYPKVYHFFAKRGFPPEDCLDLTQETFLGIYRGISSFRGEARFESWLFSIAANVYRKKLRWGMANKRKGWEVTLDAPGETDPVMAESAGARAPAPSRPEGRLLAKERQQLLREAVEELPDQMRKCLILRVYHDLKYREIAAVMRLSIDTIKAHLFQARQRVKERLGHDFLHIDL
jgi:RNA polymerase sigma-70 factor (ECF subfamily)